jgi:peptidoglycan/LPS O-acetylase OafA/YrhL
MERVELQVGPRLASLREQPAANLLLANLSPREIPSLYGLRGLAALAVVIYHYSEQRGIMALFPGPFAVTLFFELSGLLITWLLLKEVDKAGRINFRQFYARRALRLFPVFYVVWILYRLAGPFPGSWATFFYMGDYYYALHQRYSAMTIAWSLGVEEKFYLLWPFVLWRIERMRLTRILCGLLVAQPIYRSLLSFLGHSPYTWFAFDCHLDAIVLGCLIALAAKRGWTPPKWVSHPFTPVCALILIFALQSQGDIVTYLLALILVSTVSRPGWFLNNPISRYLGQISYSLYLCHSAAREILWPHISPIIHLPSGIRTFVVQTLLAIAAASVLHHLIEQPFLRLKDRFTSSHIRVNSPDPQRV